MKNKIRSAAQLALEIQKLHRRGKKIVFTNGCFDILHAGHVSYLERAAKLGDFLVVALNGDASVRKLKGPSRPINSVSDRAQVMAALQAVAYVTSFSEETPLKIILKLKPDILVKGGDWTIESMVGAKEVKSWGGKVKSLPYIKGKSTTKIIAKAGIVKP